MFIWTITSCRSAQCSDLALMRGIVFDQGTERRLIDNQPAMPIEISLRPFGERP
ncbi:hypothetical protein [Paenirhodobacter populi]|uniref:hypothetical protein n=1 Tax=Paenirhodobacter populi TaxID=2306993 RepID=UPI0019D45C4D|nr:hypothetical protein [Sinirhodobacter populi]